MHLDISPADVFRLTGQQQAAAIYRQSIDLAGSTPNMRFLERRLASCLSK
jgi:predicted RNA polymerase sigma factor